MGISQLRRRQHAVLLGLLVVFALSFAGATYAGHAPPGTKAWGYEAALADARILEYDIGTDTFVTSCVPPGSVNGRGIAFDPVDGNLWYTFVTDVGFVRDGDGLIHKATPPPACTAVTTIPFGDGPGGTIGDGIGAMDVDPDDGNIWAAEYLARSGVQFLHKVDRSTGAILESCSIPPGDGGANDTLTVARLGGLPGSGTYLLSDSSDPYHSASSLFAFDRAACTGGAAISPVATYTTPKGLTGIDYELGSLIGTNLFDIDNFGSPPFSTSIASMSASPTFELEDITLEAELVQQRPLDHFKGYKVKPAEPFQKIEGVFLADQFGDELVRVEKPELLLTPVEKRRGNEVTPISSPDSHLLCYRIKDEHGTGFPNFQKRLVKIDNQFGPLTLRAEKPETLCAPASKSLTDQPPGPTPTDLDHYKCYKVTDKGAPGEKFRKLRDVFLHDQFGEEGVVVKKPVQLCNPVEKRFQGQVFPIQRPDDHLVCYQIKDDKELDFPNFQKRGAGTRDQFAARRLTVLKPGVLCLPSTKQLIQ